MDKKQAADILRGKFEQLVSALNALPDGAEILNVRMSTCGDSGSYIQLYSNGALPDMPYETEYYQEYEPEHSVQIHGIKVLWIGEKEGEEHDNI